MGIYKDFFAESKENEISETIFLFLCNLFTMRIIHVILKNSVHLKQFTLREVLDCCVISP